FAGTAVLLEDLFPTFAFSIAQRVARRPAEPYLSVVATAGLGTLAVDRVVGAQGNRGDYNDGEGGYSLKGPSVPAKFAYRDREALPVRPGPASSGICKTGIRTGETTMLPNQMPVSTNCSGIGPSRKWSKRSNPA
ncbi:MAG: hypothetical protein O7B26_08705, partial [Planctomycetota bacterium]|nr:hypothetical protein [Planctomycetota bacterium]